MDTISFGGWIFGGWIVAPVIIILYAFHLGRTIGQRSMSNRVLARSRQLRAAAQKILAEYPNTSIAPPTGEDRNLSRAYEVAASEMERIVS